MCCMLKDQYIFCHEVEKLSALFGGINSKNNGDFYCLNCLE